MAISFSQSHSRDARLRGAGVTAVLGPTNTGKTHLAIERMLAHSSGMIGLPLRLLAREVYNKAIAKVGVEQVALVTGEEKIKPANPRFWISTVEAMPRDLDVAFVAIDEIQLGADLERGHVFTDRMLHRRGREETLVLGAATMRGMIDKLLPGANVLSRPRMSQLTHSGDRKITRLPRRSAIVAFSTEEVYAIAELIRRQRGGAAVVLGALSPRTRNAQVALFQSGEVDYLIATDAIGMGLNLDVDHVAFASDRKFDGYQFRRLNPVEFAQIAGRAGRATRDGTFGTTGRCDPFEPELVQALESHSFESVKILQWRNTILDFSSLGALQASLASLPQEQGLTRAPIAEDIRVLEHAVRDDDVRALARTAKAVERLWEVCQIPDYRKIAPATHTELAITLYGFLQREGRVPDDWFARQVAQADFSDGDIDTLSNRIAHIRTWTFAANRADWLKDPEHWQGVTRAVEDRLSDALHERLTQRFIDRRTSVLMRRLRENDMLETEISKTGEVLVEGHPIGRLDGFQFAADLSSAGSDAKALRATAQKALAGEIAARAARLAGANDDQFALATDGTIRWIGEAVGKLSPGETTLAPRIVILADEQLNGAARDSVQARLDLWVASHLDKTLGQLLALSRAEDIAGIGRGIAFQLVEALGVLERSRVAEDIKTLDQDARAMLRKYGVRFGAYHLYIPLLLKPAPRALAVQLWNLKHGGAEQKGLDELVHWAASGRTSFPVDKDAPRQLYRTIGYRVCGERAVRVDILERLADLIRPAFAWRPGAPGEKPDAAIEGGGFMVTGRMTSLTGSSGEDFASILRSLGYRMEKRPKPTPAVAVQTPKVEEPVQADGGDTTPEASVEVPVETPVDASLPIAADAEIVASEPTPEGSTLATEASETALVAESSETSAPAAIESDTMQADTAPASEPAAESAASAVPAVEQAAPEQIEVWRPGRPEGARRPPRRPARQSQPRPDRAPAPANAGPPEVAAAPAAADQAAGNEQRHQQRPARPRQFDRKREFPKRPADTGPRADAKSTPRPFHRRGGGDRPTEPKRDRAPDPNSPFAKLAALRDQLAGSAKDRSE